MARAELGVWITRAPAATVRALENTGIAFVAIDCQHTVISEAEAAEAITLTTPSRVGRLVRVSRNDPALIGRVADAGADGVIVPLVDSAAEAREAVAACRFPPSGHRSWGPFGSGMPLAPDAIEGRVEVWPMVESRGGLEELAEICAVDGIAGVFAGPADLSISHGLPPLDPAATADRNALLARIVAAAREAGVRVGADAPGGALARERAGIGFDLLTFGSDVSLLAAGVQHELNVASQ